MNKNRTIKTLWLCSWFPNHQAPYLGNFVKRQFEAVSSYSDVAAMFVTEWDGIDEIKIEINNENGLLTFIGYVPKTTNMPLKLWRYLTAYWQLYKRLRGQWGKPNLVHLNTVYPAGLFCLLLYFWQRLPFVISEHSSIYRPERQLYKGFILKTITSMCIKRAKAVLVLSNYNANIMRNIRKLHNSNYLTMPNIVDTIIFNLRQQTPKTPQTIFTFIHVSYLFDPIKNGSGILRAIAQLSKIRTDFVFKIVGDETEQPPFIKLSEELDILNKFVTFSPEIPYEDIALQMQKADAFVLFSNVEGLPCVILEAMATGLPVIATETGGISEWITPETGILLNIGDETRLVEAMSYMIDNHHNYDPSVIRSKIIEKCSVDVVGKAIVSVYEEVLRDKCRK